MSAENFWHFGQIRAGDSTDALTLSVLDAAKWRGNARYFVPIQIKII